MPSILGLFQSLSQLLAANPVDPAASEFSLAAVAREVRIGSPPRQDAPHAAIPMLPRESSAEIVRVRVRRPPWGVRNA